MKGSSDPTEVAAHRLRTNSLKVLKVGGESDLNFFLCQVESGGQDPLSFEVWVWLHLKVFFQFLQLFPTVLLVKGIQER